MSLLTAFSQLTADNQFAPLGVVLLGVLAQIHAACDCVAPKPVTSPLSPSARDISVPAESTPLNVESEAVPSTRNTTGLSALEPRPATGDLLTAPQGKKISREEAVGGRKGKAVSREDVERAAAQRKKGKEANKAQTKKIARAPTITDGAEAVAPTEGTTAISSGKRQVLSAQDGGGDEDTRPAKKTKTAPTTAERGKGQCHEPDKDKKKKKVKKGDEFDDLFKGLF
ncbi:hypothetical protein NUW58_g9811 [Xylaria curta]|uniref:Uncharacterized protein n=1 Tax=Xylaria curta TaxID=42375 RepID=A0ACC1MSV2_9PEZI|nr:hypothetical protein NUW58_g9811 [Xylaria curta]